MVDVEVSATVPGASSPTASTMTSASGGFSLNVPAGTYDIKVMPIPGRRLANTTLPAISIAQNRALSLLLFLGGLTWSATVRDGHGTPVPNQQIDVHQVLGQARRRSRCSSVALA